MKKGLFIAIYGVNNIGKSTHCRILCERLKKEGLVKHLLGRTIIVRNLVDAERMASQNPPMYRYVTQSGE